MSATTTSENNPWPLPPEINSKYLQVNGLKLHFLESPPKSQEEQQAPLVILLHGFPELSYSWRKIILPLSEAGYHVVAPDQRGYGRTTFITQAQDTTRGDEAAGLEELPLRFNADLAPFRILNLVEDIVAFVHALGYNTAAAVVGHDFGSTVAGSCALTRPDIFKSVVMMSAPFPGAPTFSPAKDSENETRIPSLGSTLREQLASLVPPRKHYQHYYSTPEANDDMLNAPQGLHTFFREYYHAKSADWAGNIPHPLPSASAQHLAIMPHYYIMRLEQTMPEAVKGVISPAADNDGDASCAWLTDDELAVYVAEYSRTGFQGGLNWYRSAMNVKYISELQMYSAMRIVVPAMFISGKQDWGTYQSPGVAEHMKERVCERMDDNDFVLIEGAGHWVQQEQSDEVVRHLLRFLGKLAPA